MKMAIYEMKDCGEVFTAITMTSWQQKYGRCDTRTHFRHGTLYTRKALKAWGRRNGVEIAQKDLDKMPVN